MSTETKNSLKGLEKQISLLGDNRQWTEARELIENIEKEFQPSMESDPSSAGQLALVIELKGDLMQRMGEVEVAKDSYRKAISLTEEIPELNPQTARVYCCLAVIAEDEDDEASSIELYQKSIAFFESIPSSLEIGLADAYNNLAFLHRLQEDYDQAETLFLKGLKVSHKIEGVHSERSASICNNLGAIYMAIGFYEQAKEMHLMALEGREEVKGVRHPETAQSHGNLAVTLNLLNEPMQAQNHFEMALAGYEVDLENNESDYATIAGNFADFLNNHGKEKAALELQRRISKTLKKASAGNKIH